MDRIVSVVQQIDANHDELIHDSVANYYGTRLATCSGDSKIKIFELNGDQTTKLLADIPGHNGAVWQLSWSHPEFDNLLASCSYDRKVKVWKEVNGNWELILEYKEHESSVNSVEWAPREYGLMLACASADGYISIIKPTVSIPTESKDWESVKIKAHDLGVNAVSWAQPLSSVSPIYRLNTGNTGNAIGSSGEYETVPNKPMLVKRFVSGGCDNLIKIWRYDDKAFQWIEEHNLNAHTDWVRDVAWAPSIGLPKWYIASCSQDKRVIIHTNNDGPNGRDWDTKILQEFNDIVWHVSWSIMGNMLAVTWGENNVSLYKEDMNGEFRCISDVNTP